MIEQVGELLLTTQYWDCNCDYHYIHSHQETTCPKCLATRNEQPDSRVEEVLRLLAPHGNPVQQQTRITMKVVYVLEDPPLQCLLMQQRLSGPSPSYCGLTFPGGIIEQDKRITEYTQTLIHNDTNLKAPMLHLFGTIVQEATTKNPKQSEQYNSTKDIVFLFRTHCLSGTLSFSNRKPLAWMALDEIPPQELPDETRQYLQLLHLDTTKHPCFGCNPIEVTPHDRTSVVPLL